MGRTGEAIKLAEHVGAGLQPNHRPDDPEAISCPITLAAIYGATGHPAKAVGMLALRS